MHDAAAAAAAAAVAVVDVRSNDAEACCADGSGLTLSLLSGLRTRQLLRNIPTYASFLRDILRCRSHSETCFRADLNLHKIKSALCS